MLIPSRANRDNTRLDVINSGYRAARVPSGRRSGWPTSAAWSTSSSGCAAFTEFGVADVLDMWTGSSERNLAAIFAAARRNAPCVLFFDEVDALGHKRSHLATSSSMRNTVNQLLAEMDSTSGRNDGVFVLGATNHPWDVDSALRRPGRFDRMLLVLPPDLAARQAILSHRPSRSTRSTPPPGTTWPCWTPARTARVGR